MYSIIYLWQSRQAEWQQAEGSLGWNSAEILLEIRNLNAVESMANVNVNGVGNYYVQLWIVESMAKVNVNKNDWCISETRCRRLWTSGQKWWMHSLGRELKKKKLLYSSIDRIYGSFEFVLFTSEIASSIFVTMFLVSLNFWMKRERERERVVVQVPTPSTLAILSTI